MKPYLAKKDGLASIHFPLAREDKMKAPVCTGKYASIHFPLAREDVVGTSAKFDALMLQSTSLLRGKTSA